MASLTRVEAAARAALIDVTSYDVDLDLDQRRADFGSRTTIRFTVPRAGRARRSSTSGRTSLHRVTLNGAEVDPAELADGRLALRRPRRRQRRRRRARRWPTATTARACTARSTPPTASTTSTATCSSTPRRGSSRCFDQPDLKAPYAVSRHRPGGLDRRRQRRRHAGRPGALAARDDPAAGDLLRHGLRRALRLGARRARRHPAGHPRPAPRCEEPSSGRPTQMLEVTRQSLRLLPPAVRHPVPVRRVPPGVRARSSTPARWRTPAA